jgi:hypothetical protein
MSICTHHPVPFPLMFTLASPLHIVQVAHCGTAVPSPLFGGSMMIVAETPVGIVPLDDVQSYAGHGRQSSTAAKELVASRTDAASVPGPMTLISSSPLLGCG